MTVYRVSPIRGLHFCELPSDSDRKMLEMIRGDVWTCDECGTAFLLAPIPWERDWIRVRWYHFRTRRRMKETWC